MKTVTALVLAFLLIAPSVHAWQVPRFEHRPRPSLEERLCKRVAALFKLFPTPPPMPEVCGGAPVPVPVPAPDPEPTPSIDHLLISEVYYDTDDTHGSEPANEWVELYNPTEEALDLAGWSLVDASGSVDVIAGGVVQPKSFALVTSATTTATYWGIPAPVPVIVLGSSIGNALGNTGDSLKLTNAASTTIDALSWGSDTSTFNPSAPDVPAGHSLARVQLDTDTDTLSDWKDAETPTPGH